MVSPGLSPRLLPGHLGLLGLLQSPVCGQETAGQSQAPPGMWWEAC